MFFLSFPRGRLQKSKVHWKAGVRSRGGLECAKRVGQLLQPLLFQPSCLPSLGPPTAAHRAGRPRGSSDFWEIPAAAPARTPFWGTGRCINWPSPSRLNGASAAHDSAREAQQPFAPPALESQHNDCPIAQSHQRWRGNAAAPVRMALHPPSPPVPAASLRHGSNG